MKNLTVQMCTQVVCGQLIGSDAVLTGMSIDTRTLQPGQLYVALVGQKFDGHQFITQAIAAGAPAVLVEQLPKQPQPEVQYIVVEDTQRALGQIAAWYFERQRQQSQIKTIALTGSCGKTSVKEMIAAILRQRGPVLATRGNLNNEIGVPLTLLEVAETDQYAVIELGANHIGEIAYTSSLVNPDVALVNNVAAAHLEGFGSLAGVEQAKGEIFQGLLAGGVAVINSESQSDLWQADLADKTQVLFSQSNPGSDFYAQNIHLDSNGCAHFDLITQQGSVAITLAVVGQHQVANAVAAAALAWHCGIDLATIATGLAQVQPVGQRVETQQITERIRLIDDSYNASMPAMRAAIELLAHFSGVRWLILGEMKELGEYSASLHQQLAEYAAQFQFTHVLTYGDDAKIVSQRCQGHHFATHAAMLTYMEKELAQQANEMHTILVKGARSTGMNKIVTALQERTK